MLRASHPGRFTVCHTRSLRLHRVPVFSADAGQGYQTTRRRSPTRTPREGVACGGGASEKATVSLVAIVKRFDRVAVFCLEQ